MELCFAKASLFVSRNGLKKGMGSTLGRVVGIEGPQKRRCPIVRGSVQQGKRMGKLAQVQLALRFP